MLLPLLLSLLFHLSLSSNILIWSPTISLSHVRFMENIANVIASDGHNLTVIYPVIDPRTNIMDSTKNIKTIRYISPYNNPEEWSKMEVFSPDFWSLPQVEGETLSEDDLNQFISITEKNARGFIEEESLIRSLRETHFDLGITELFDLGAVGVFEVLGINTSIVAGALGTVYYHHAITGIPTFPSFVPTWLSTYGDRMSFFERLNCFKSFLSQGRLYSRYTRRMEDIFKQFDPNFPQIEEVMKRQVAVILSNVNEFSESSRPTSNMVQNIGGAAIYPPKKLNKEMEEVLSIRGITVLFSLGSMAKSCHIPTNIKLEILNAFSDFSEITFLWKYEECVNDTVDFSQYPNVIRRQWFPQTDLLADPRVVFFITHAGMNSVLEAEFRGKPMITIPLFADQQTNAKNAARRGVAIYVERTDITRKSLSSAIAKIIDEKSGYIVRSLAVSQFLAGRSEEYRNSIRKWVRLLAQHGNFGHLPLISQEMSFIQLYSIDCILYLFTQVVIVVLIGVGSTVYLYRRTVLRSEKL